MRSLSHVVAALIPAGKAELKSLSRTPSGESWRQNPGKLRRGTEPVFPTQRPFVSIPVVRFIFSGRVSFATKVRAREMAEDQEPVAVTFAVWEWGEEALYLWGVRVFQIDLREG